MVANGTAIPLSSFLRPNSFLCRTDPRDALSEQNKSFVCSLYEQDAGPNNQWVEPGRMKVHLHHLFHGCMAGRTMYVIPFCLAPIDSDLATYGIQVTDSPYVVAHAYLLARMGKAVLEKVDGGDFVRCVHSVGVPKPLPTPDEPGGAESANLGEEFDAAVLQAGPAEPWPCNPDEAVISHFPESGEVWSFGSGQLNNALLTRVATTLTLGSVRGRDEGWVAAHMAVFGVENPRGRKKYFGAMFPGHGGKTQLATISPILPGWRVSLVSDDTAWIKARQDGRLHAMSPETGICGVAAGLSVKTNPNLTSCIQENAIFTNVALTEEGDVWWEGLTDEPPAGLLNWRGAPWKPELEEPAAHPDGRFTVGFSQYAMKDESWDDPDGVPLDAILVGGRRSNTMPLVMRSFSWRHGVMLAAGLGFEILRFQGELGKLKRDPLAMNGICGYDLGSYVQDFLALEKTVPNSDRLPGIFEVNWFLIGSAFRPLWPGHAENLRVLKWIFENLDGSENTVDCPIGRIPEAGSLDLRGLDLSALAQHELLTVDNHDLRSEAWLINELLQDLGERVPPALEAEVEALGERLLMGFVESTAHRPGTQMPASEVLGTSPHQAVGVPSR